MYQFLEQNSLFVVLGIVLIIWAGISVYLFFIDSNIRKLEQRLSNIEPRDGD
jgi:CcmD family protein